MSSDDERPKHDEDDNHDQQPKEGVANAEEVIEDKDEELRKLNQQKMREQAEERRKHQKHAPNDDEHSHADGDGSDDGAGHADQDLPRWTLSGDVRPRVVDWLWPGRIAFGEICSFDGDPSVSKSTLALTIAATASKGAQWPDGGHSPKCAVLVCSAEDNPETVIKPRLMVAGENQELISILTDTDLSLPRDIPIIEQRAKEVGAKLVIIDPLNTFLSGNIDDHRDQQIRLALNPLVAMARRLNLAVVLIRHLNKGKGGNPLYRGGGSIGKIAAVRTALLIGLDPNDKQKRVCINYKNNLTKLQPSLTYELLSIVVTFDGKASEQSRISWQHEPSNLTAQDILGAEHKPEQASTIVTAEEFLLEQLKGGPVPCNTVLEDGGKQGLSQPTIRRAAKDLKVKSEYVPKDGKRKAYWTWKLP